ncbi:hypothetical protein SAY87_008544 [Trapa incisa]|uniref:Uncharacterized protein n=1 Tax=Trapa incisa TaxID=236973 RepID=A0AAN7PV60_9MYRT|nr:hypothetical protein SAY87_008544 [Trapa incisa]
MKNDGESSLNIIGIRASVHLPYDHSLLVQNLTGQGFNNASVPASAQGFFPLHLYCQQVPTVFYEIDQQPYQTVFYNGTIEVAESGGFFSVELVFLATFGVSLLVLLDLWVQGRVQSLSKVLIDKSSHALVNNMLSVTLVQASFFDPEALPLLKSSGLCLD